MFSQVKINLKNIKHNIDEYRNYLNSGTKIMGVVKSNAYGHGILEVAKYIENLVDVIAVVSLDEALFLLENGIKQKIFILSFWQMQEELLLPALKANVIFPVYRKEQVQYLANLIEKYNLKGLSVFLKVDTGARRIGIEIFEVEDFLKFIHSFPKINLLGIYSHFASSEENYEYTLEQLDKFLNLKNNLKENNLEYHFACSAASLVLANKASFNYIRLGLAMYGLWPDPSLKAHYAHHVNLQPALEWTTKFIHIKKIPKNSYVGYGNTFKTERDTILGVIPVGYWDGYDRKLSNKGEVVVKGQKCPVIGRVCMNLTMVDLTDLNEKVDYDDEVILLGQGQTAEDIADKIGTINYEVVTRINAEIPRIYLK